MKIIYPGTVEATELPGLTADSPSTLQFTAPHPVAGKTAITIECEPDELANGLNLTLEPAGAAERRMDDYLARMEAAKPDIRFEVIELSQKIRDRLFEVGAYTSIGSEVHLIKAADSAEMEAEAKRLLAKYSKLG